MSEAAYCAVELDDEGAGGVEDLACFVGCLAVDEKGGKGKGEAEASVDVRVPAFGEGRSVGEFFSPRGQEMPVTQVPYFSG